jgi:heptosyltransferase-2
MAQPLLRLLKQAHPERAIDVLAPPQVVPVWRASRKPTTSW